MLKLLSKIFTKIDEELFENLEEQLILADCGMLTTEEILSELRKKVREKNISEPEAIKQELRGIMRKILAHEPLQEQFPKVILMIGVNGVGKTTTLGKLAMYYKTHDKSAILAAGDTFRAAASEQLTVWAERVDAPIIKQSEGADPAAVVFDALDSFKAKGADVLLIDTAGRLHNKQNLMDELAKIRRVVNNSGFPCETLLVLDSSLGQNALIQAKAFSEVTQIDGIVLTKMDSTAKGGVVLAIAREQNVPVKFVGLGEKATDLREFDAEWFVNELV